MSTPQDKPRSVPAEIEVWHIDRLREYARNSMGVSQSNAVSQCQQESGSAETNER